MSVGGIIEAISSYTNLREAAVASEAEFRKAGLSPGANPVQAGISYCIPGAQDARRLRARLKGQSLCCLFAALFLWALAGFLFFLVYTHGLGFMGGLALAGGCILVLGGLGILLFMTQAEPVLVTFFMQQRFPALWTDVERPPQPLRLENATTYKTFKLIADDMGVIAFYPETHCIQIEGISYRYLVHAADVVELTCFRENPEGINLTYRIASVELKLVVIPYRPGTFLAMSSTLLPPETILRVPEV